MIPLEHFDWAGLENPAYPGWRDIPGPSFQGGGSLRDMADQKIKVIAY